MTEQQAQAIIAATLLTHQAELKVAQGEIERLQARIEAIKLEIQEKAEARNAMIAVLTASVQNGA